MLVKAVKKAKDSVVWDDPSQQNYTWIQPVESVGNTGLVNKGGCGVGLLHQRDGTQDLHWQSALEMRVTYASTWLVAEVTTQSFSRCSSLVGRAVGWAALSVQSC
jgi:hypothetical protein